jgi:hypothetical protein
MPAGPDPSPAASPDGGVEEDWLQKSRQAACAERLRVRPMCVSEQHLSSLDGGGDQAILELVFGASDPPPSIPVARGFPVGPERPLLKGLNPDSLPLARRVTGDSRCSPPQPPAGRSPWACPSARTWGEIAPRSNATPTQASSPVLPDSLAGFAQTCGTIDAEIICYSLGGTVPGSAATSRFIRVGKNVHPLSAAWCRRTVEIRGNR